MNIDSNAIFTLVTIGAAAFFAIGYFRMKLNERFTEVHRAMGDQGTELFREQEKLWQRIVTLEKCCKAGDCKTEKNYYNTGV
jgi:hypothetical protein